jgi:hypothetical protein
VGAKTILFSFAKQSFFSKKKAAIDAALNEYFFYASLQLVF